MDSMTGELDVLRRVSQVLDQAGLDYMLTGSMALAYYATPRMTRDIDIVIGLKEHDIARLQIALGEEFYFDPDAARQAVLQQRMFNLMHMDSAIKVDLVVRKSSDYRQLEFQRRRLVDFKGVSAWIVSCEDLILSKGPAARDGIGVDGASAVNDTDPRVEAMVRARYAAMTPLQRMEIVSSMFDTARAIVASSLPPGLTREQRRYAIAKRFYGDELPEAALQAHARYFGGNDPT
jgi:hypothetical protein